METISRHAADIRNLERNRSKWETSPAREIDRLKLISRNSIGVAVFAFRMDSLQWSKMKNVARTALIVALGLLVGCSNSSNPAMTGTWLFGFTPLESSAVVLQFTANLTQEGSQITGQVSLTGDAASCGTAGSMQGTLMGNSLSLQFNQLDSTINLSGTVNPEFTSATGTYTGASGSCLLNGGIGSWSAVLQ
jgi:hypothetical protein